MAYQLHDTIAAIASAAAGGARGIVRASGPSVPQLLEALFIPELTSDLASVSQATVIPGLVRLERAAPGADGANFSRQLNSAGTLPAELYFWPSQRSYTRQPTAELHTLGSPPLVDRLLQACCEAGARLAEPGEFTMRAFLAGRLDLTQAEAVLGVIDAQDQRQLTSALRQLAGGLAQLLNELRDRLLELLAHLEAGLDFVEEDIQFIDPNEISLRLDDSQRMLVNVERQLETRAESTAAPRVVLTGLPNAGKSSLFNRLAAGDALVSELPGTTRDYLSARVNFTDLAFELVDTAGVEGMPSLGISQRAQALSMQQRSAADLVLHCIDASNVCSAHDSSIPAERGDVPQLLVLTKCDLPTASHPPRSTVRAIATSALTGAGLFELKDAIVEQLSKQTRAAEAVVPATAVRCRESVRLARSALTRAAEMHQAGAGDELLAAELRVCLDELGTVVGAVYTDDILDRIFSRFCIGK